MNPVCDQHVQHDEMDADVECPHLQLHGTGYKTGVGTTSSFSPITSLIPGNSHGMATDNTGGMNCCTHVPCDSSQVRCLKRSKRSIMVRVQSLLPFLRR